MSSAWCFSPGGQRDIRTFCKDNEPLQNGSSTSSSTLKPFQSRCSSFTTQRVTELVGKMKMRLKNPQRGDFRKRKQSLRYNKIGITGFHCVRLQSQIDNQEKYFWMPCLLLTTWSQEKDIDAQWKPRNVEKFFFIWVLLRMKLKSNVCPI